MKLDEKGKKINGHNMDYFFLNKILKIEKKNEIFQ
jgi:hypothetical protein